MKAFAAFTVKVVADVNLACIELNTLFVTVSKDEVITLAFCQFGIGKDNVKFCIEFTPYWYSKLP